jgi:hypothetical protein
VPIESPARALVKNVRIFDGISPHLSDGHVRVEGSTVVVKNSLPTG